MEIFDKRPHFAPSAYITIFLGSLLLYFLTRTNDFYWDGITYALQIETYARTQTGIWRLFHQNHLLYTAQGYFLFALLAKLGVHARALTVLQLQNVFVGAAANCAFLALAFRIFGKRSLALLATLLLAVAAGWWKVSTDANAYLPSTFFVLLCAANLFGEKPRWYVAGSALAGAMLIHQMGSLFFPAALLVILTRKRIANRWNFAVAFAALAWSVTLAVYAVCAHAWFDRVTPAVLVRWAVSNQSEAYLTFEASYGVPWILKNNLDLFAGHAFGVFRKFGGPVEYAFAGLFVLSALTAGVLFLKSIGARSIFTGINGLFRNVGEHGRTLAVILAAWIIPYFILLLIWEPFLVIYRVFYLPPLILVMGCLAMKFNRTAGIFPFKPVVAGIVALFFFNLAFFIVPYRHPEANVFVSAAKAQQSVWKPGTVIFFADPGQEDVAFMYFNPRVKWEKVNAKNLNGFYDSIGQRLAETGEDVWINGKILDTAPKAWAKQFLSSDTLRVESPFGKAVFVRLKSSGST